MFHCFLLKRFAANMLRQFPEKKQTVARVKQEAYQSLPVHPFSNREDCCDALPYFDPDPHSPAGIF